MPKYFPGCYKKPMPVKKQNLPHQNLMPIGNFLDHSPFTIDNSLPLFPHIKLHRRNTCLQCVYCFVNKINGV